MKMKWLKKLFSPPPAKMICGGVGHIEIVDNLGRVKSKLYYTRPDSDMKLNYTYEYQHITANEGQLREIKAVQDKGGSTPKKIHEIIERDLFLPWAEKIFVECLGYYDNNNKLLDHKEKKIQLNMLKKFYSNHLVAMVSNAFLDNSCYKKKD